MDIVVNQQVEKLKIVQEYVVVMLMWMGVETV